MHRNIKNFKKWIVLMAHMCQWHRCSKLLKANFVIPEDRIGAFKFDVNLCTHDGDTLDQKNSDGQTAFQLYIVDQQI